EAGDALRVLGARGQRDDRRVGLRAQLPQQVGAVGVGKSEVEHDERGLHLVEEGASACAGGRVLDDESRVPQVQRHELRHRCVVLDDDDAGGAAHERSIRRGIVAEMEGTLAVILAHPDDETFGTGGTLIKYASEGIKVHSLCLTEGEKGWAGGEGAPMIPREHVGAARALELEEAGRRMGLASVTCLKYPD